MDRWTDVFQNFSEFESLGGKPKYVHTLFMFFYPFFTSFYSQISQSFKLPFYLSYLSFPLKPNTSLTFNRTDASDR